MMVMMLFGFGTALCMVVAVLYTAGKYFEQQLDKETRKHPDAGTQSGKEAFVLVFKHMRYQMQKTDGKQKRCPESGDQVHSLGRNALFGEKRCTTEQYAKNN